MPLASARSPMLQPPSPAACHLPCPFDRHNQLGDRMIVPAQVSDDSASASTCAASNAKSATTKAKQDLTYGLHWIKVDSAPVGGTLLKIDDTLNETTKALMGSNPLETALLKQESFSTDDWNAVRANRQGLALNRRACPADAVLAAAVTTRRCSQKIQGRPTHSLDCNVAPAIGVNLSKQPRTSFPLSASLPAICPSLCKHRSAPLSPTLLSRTQTRLHATATSHSGRRRTFSPGRSG